MGKRILWLDWSVKIYSALTRGIEDAGNIVDKRNRVYKAIMAVDSVPYGGIISDLILPGDKKFKHDENHPYLGVDFVRYVREKSEHNKGTPVVVYTAEKDPRVLEEVRELGVSDIIPKSVMPLEFRKRVEKAFDLQLDVGYSEFALPVAGGHEE